MLVQQGDDLRRTLRSHVGGRSIKPDHCRKLAIIAQQLLKLRDGLGVQVSIKIAILRLVPMVGDRIVMVPWVGIAAGGSPVLVLGVVEAELDALLAALLGELTERVALERRGSDDVEGIRFRV